ncbi:MAG: IS607 family transposase [Candidatus Cloacimonetes bacterium]|jgi:putative resolvase|nr:IS607 family transposase [Candidatus Cloacimonadota bacterium]
MDKLLSISKTAKMLGVSDETLRNWHRDGKLVPVKTKGGHRRYLESDILALLGIKTVPQEIKDACANKVAIYGRVSSHDQKQKGDLDRQCQRLSEYCAKKHYTVEHIIKDVGSGLSDSRVGLNRLFDLVISQQIRKVIIENNDRLTRFQFNVLVRFFDSYGIIIECVEKGDKTDEQDLVDDIMMLMASFSGKLYGRRSAKRRMEKKEQGKTNEKKP